MSPTQSWSTCRNDFLRRARLSPQSLCPSAPLRLALIGLGTRPGNSILQRGRLIGEIASTGECGHEPSYLAVIVVEDENADSSQIIKDVILAVRARQKPPTIADEIAKLKIRVSAIEATPK